MQAVNRNVGVNKVTNRPVYFVALIMTLLLAASLIAQTEQNVHATPQRPSFSTNTATTHLGWLEFELGGSVDEHRFDVPAVLKVGLVEHLEAFAALMPIADSEGSLDDMTLGGRLRFMQDEERQLSLAAQASLTTSEFDFSRGTDLGFLLILSKAFGEYGLDLNAGLNVIDGSDDQFVGIATVGRSLAAAWSGYAELLLVQDSGFDHGMSAASFGVSYGHSPRTVFDLALNIGISDAPYDVQLLGGITHAFSKLW